MDDRTNKYQDQAGEAGFETALVVNLDGFEGPLDLLLTMGRSQKVDLLNISILELAEQYLAFVEQAHTLRMTLAADYLVMAAWLTFLKSQLLLPVAQDDDAPSGEELAAYLAFKLERLSAMRDVAARLVARDRLGQDFFSRGLPELVVRSCSVTYSATLLDLMQAYARLRTRDSFAPYAAGREKTLSFEDALEHLRKAIGYRGDWATLWSYLPEEWRQSDFMCRSGLASSFVASLELAKQGVVELRQAENFAPLEIRKRERAQ